MNLKSSLVLGFPAVIAELVTALLLESGQTVYLLLPQDLFSRAAAIKKKYGKKLQLLVGNGGHLDFGLSGGDYLKIAGEVDAVFCLYTETQHHESGDFNGLLVHELVEFCKVAPRVQRLLLLSDFAFTKGFGGMVAERDMDVPLVTGGGGEGPVRVEKVLRRFNDMIPTTVVRAGTMVGIHEPLFPVVLLALGYPELFARSNVYLVLAEVHWIAQQIVEMVEKAEPGYTFHLYQRAFSPRNLGAEVMQLAMSQLPRTFDMRAAARRNLKHAGNVARNFAAVQIDAKIENSWTNRYLRAHNFHNLESELNWQPLIENEVEKLTGFR